MEHQTFRVHSLSFCLSQSPPSFCVCLSLSFSRTLSLCLTHTLSLSVHLREPCIARSPRDTISVIAFLSVGLNSDHHGSGGREDFFTKNMTGVQCFGLAPVVAASVVECRDACCLLPSCECPSHRACLSGSVHPQCTEPRPPEPTVASLLVTQGGLLFLSMGDTFCGVVPRR